MPYPTEHAARIKSPTAFRKDTFRRKNIKSGIDIIMGKLKDNGDSMVTQSYRFKSNKFTVAEAKKWLKDHKIKYILFEPATGEKKSEENMKITHSIFDAEIELRSDENKKTLHGYAAKFDSLSVPLFGFREKIRKGAFTESIKKNNIRALWNHNTDLVLGSTKNGTLQLEENARGLKFELELPDTQAGRDAGISVSRGDVDGMSFAFEAIKQEWDEKNEKNVVRTLIEVDVKEISPTAFPAYPTSKVMARSVKDDYEDYTEEQRSIDEEEQKAEKEKQKIINSLKLKNQHLSILQKEIL